MEFSKYVRIFTNILEENIVFNTVNRATVLLPKNCFYGKSLKDDLSQDDLNTLSEMGFFDDEQKSLIFLKNSLEDTDKLMISLETTLSCNLRCPYCYQINSEHNKKHIENKYLDHLISYLERVYQKSPYKYLVFKVLGGEPTVIWEKTLYVLEKVKKFCANNKIYLKLMIDTNCTNVDPILNLSGYDSLLLTIPLTHISCHDKVRKTAEGKGTYEIIIDNLNKLASRNANIKLILRHNTDHENYRLFESYIQNLKKKLMFSPTISLHYTAELGDGGFKNNLSYEDFIQWQSFEAIDILVKHDFKVTITPSLATEKCQCMSRYSVKMFSDGTVGACAMYFFDKKRPLISELLEDIDNVLHYWDGIKNFSIFDDIKCRECESVFLCGGAYRWPCIKSLKIKECSENGGYNINLEKYIAQYFKYIQQGKEDLFIGFNDSDSVDIPLKGLL